MPDVTEPRRFPPPWTAREMEECFVIEDANGQPLAYLYFDDEASRQNGTKRLTRDEAWRIAVNFARLPSLLSRR
jgi:hypothetical protein